MAESGETLSERELDVLRCVSSGASNKQIASELSISQNTVKVHLRNIYTKLDVSSRTEATTVAIQQGYITVSGVENSAVTTETPTATETIAEQSIATESTTAVVEQPHKRNWRTPVLLLLLLFSIFAITILGLQVMNQNQVMATPEPFEETTVGDSRWISSRPMPEGRANMAVASIGLDIYKIGGETTSGVDGKVTVYDSVDRIWQEAAEKPTAVADASAVELYGELYVPGGRLVDGQPTATVEAYSPSQDAWRLIASLPQPLFGGLTLSDGGFLYVFGGWDGEKYLDTVFKYDPSADSWRPLPPMPEARAFAAGGTLTGKPIVVGGANEQGQLPSCHIFDPAGEEWSGCPDMLQPRAAAGSAVILNKLYVIGGGLDSEVEVSFSEVYDPNSETWQVVNTPMLDGRSSWPHTGVGHVETRIYALGGRHGDIYLDDTLIYAPLVYKSFIPAASSGNEK
jgi:DNA-binding CsgD family transcriptional regulator/N-acetylneuraminic acid mutarotase